MDEIIIKGGNPLSGSVSVAGAKNAALPALAASMLVAGKTTLKNVPDVRDISIMCKLLNQLGVMSKRTPQGLVVDASEIASYEAPYDLVRTMRASVLLLGPLLARLGKAKVSLPGGCAIGTRPIDMHLKAFNQLGAQIELQSGMVSIHASDLKGADIYLDFPTVTGTENIMMAATGARGQTRIFNAAKEPEVADLGKLLNIMGFCVEGAGTDTITVLGGRKSNACSYTIIPDRIEAGTYAIAAAITRGKLEITDVVPEHLTSVLAKLGQTGADIEIAQNRIVVQGSSIIRTANIQTAVFPGYPTDLQAQFMALMCLAQGESVITENIFENRFMHVSELNRMGADITTRGSNAFVKGVQRLSGVEVMATDLRASASLVLAGLAAEGDTRILRVYHLDRGYEAMVEKLQSVGAKIERVQGRGP